MFELNRLLIRCTPYFVHANTGFCLICSAHWNETFGRACERFGRMCGRERVERDVTRPRRRRSQKHKTLISLMYKFVQQKITEQLFFRQQVSENENKYRRLRKISDENLKGKCDRIKDSKSIQLERLWCKNHRILLYSLYERLSFIHLKKKKLTVTVFYIILLRYVCFVSCSVEKINNYLTCMSKQQREIQGSLSHLLSNLPIYYHFFLSLSFGKLDILFSIVNKN